MSKEIDEDGYVVRPNKTQIKKDIAELRKLAEQLIALANNKLEQLSLDAELLAAVNAARKMKKAALQRQLRYITGIMKAKPETDISKIQKQYDILLLPQQQTNDSLHQLESWRERLIAGDNDLLNELVENYQADRQYLRQLLRNIHKEQQTEAETDIEKGQAQRLPKTARVLFKYLQELLIHHAG